MLIRYYIIYYNSSESIDIRYPGITYAGYYLQNFICLRKLISKLTNFLARFASISYAK